MVRVAAYCRVSTDNDDQANSFESQQRYFRDYIDRNPEWDLVRIFADEGISGTSTKKRKEFNRMIALAQNGEIDLIITKEVSRFARNTLDTLQYTRELRRIGVFVLFMNDNINTKDPDAELRLTIMASIAQEESRKTSERVKWGQKRRMEQGVVFGRDMLGYDVRDGELHINEEGAKTVRLIYHKFLEEGKGTHVIARELREAGIKTSRFMIKWSNTVILRVLRNEKYCGDLIQKKTITPDYLTHEKKQNTGEEEFVVLRNHHEPIISREIFERTQRELARRSPSPEQKAKHSNRYCLSGKIYCGACGSRFVARTKKRKDGSQYKAWRCFEASTHGRPKIDAAGNHVGCEAGQQIRDEDFMIMIQSVIAHLNHDKEQLISDLIEIVKFVLRIDKSDELDLKALESQADVLTEKKERLLDLYVENNITKDEYRQMQQKYNDEIQSLCKKKEELEKRRRLAADKDKIIADIAETIRSLALGEKQDDIFYRNLVEKIVVYNRKYIEIYLNLIPYKWVCSIAELQGESQKKNKDKPFLENGSILRPLYQYQLRSLSPWKMAYCNAAADSGLRLRAHRRGRRAGK